METPEQDDHNNTSSSWSSATNWSIAGGSLANHVNFESSLSPIDGDTLNSTAESSLILHPPSPDSGPCEITINFTQKHEVQQIYVRSTARVYEIYYAPDLPSDNEYLCTVRCGIAARDEEVLHTADNEEVRSANSNGSLKDVSEENLRNSNNLSTSEDDWVEVKVPDNHVPDKRISSLPLKSGSEQAFYEATARMSDVNPCISVTLRLLSLERKDCLYVDEIYVFADPADSADLENQASTAENSAGSSLMAMFMPTLLQLSKTRSVNQTQDSRMIGSKSSDSTSVATKIETDAKPSIPDHQEVKFQDVNRDTVGSTHSQIPPQVPVTESKSDTAYRHVERSVDLLFSRMGRIEDLLLGFEEKMVKPISSIEARLERVEQQLEILSKQSQNSGLSTCSRFCAPSFSCIESDSNSFYNSGNDCPSCEAVILGNKDAQSEALPALPTTPYYMSDSVNSKLVPRLVVTAPEFSSDDEEEEDQLSGVVINPSENRPRPALTIDDALASALAGFMTLTSTQPQKYTQTLSVKAPEFLNEEDGSPDTKASAVEEIGIDTSICFDESDGTQNVKDSLADSSRISSYSEGNVIRSNDEHSVKPDGIHVRHQHYEGREEIGTDTSICFDESDGTQNVKDSLADSSRISSYSEGNVIRSNDEHSVKPDGIHVRHQHYEGREEIGTDTSICFDESDGTQNVKDSLADSSRISSYCEGNVIRSNDEHSVKPDRIHVRHQHYEGREEDKPDGKSCENAVDPANHGMALSDFCQITEEIENGVVSSEISNIANPDKTDIPNGMPQNETDDGFNKTQDDAHTKEVTEENSDKDVLKNILEFSRSSSVVDFEIPVLDVKFTSREGCNATCSLAALLSESPESMTEAPCVRESDDVPPVGEESSLILVEDGEPVGPAPDGNFSVDMDFYSVAEPLSTWGANLQCDTSNSHKTFAASLI